MSNGNSFSNGGEVLMPRWFRVIVVPSNGSI